MKFNLIPELLDALVAQPDIKSAAAAVGITERVVYRWTVWSRSGKAELQEVEWCGVLAPFHVHRENARRLAVDAIEAAFLDRCRNGYYVGSYFKGEPVWQTDEKIVASGITDPDELELCFGQRDQFLRVDGKRVQVMQLMKPSEQAVQAALSHWRGYTAKTELAVTLGGVLRVDGDQPKQIEHAKPAAESFEDKTGAVEGKQPSNYLAVHREAKNQNEMDNWQAAGVFAPAEIEFVAEDGGVTAVKQDIKPPAAAMAAPPVPAGETDPVEMTTAAATPETAEPTQAGKSALRADLEARLAALKTNGPTHAHPRSAVPVGRPSDEPAADPQSGQRVAPADRADQAGLGAGRVPPGGFPR